MSYAAPARVFEAAASGNSISASFASAATAFRAAGVALSRFVSSAGRVSPACKIAPQKAASQPQSSDLCDYGSYGDAVWCSSCLSERS